MQEEKEEAQKSYHHCLLRECNNSQTQVFKWDIYLCEFHREDLAYLIKKYDFSSRWELITILYDRSYYMHLPENYNSEKEKAEHFSKHPSPFNCFYYRGVIKEEKEDKNY